MSKLDLESRITIKTMLPKGVGASEVARLLRVTEGAVVWSPRKDLPSWLHCYSEAFRRLGGVTATVRVDNEKTAVVRSGGAWGTINPAYRRYAVLMRFHVDACAPREPQAKGKVER